MTDLRSGDPETIGQFRIVRRLGVGGMGVVYLADGRHGRVALKVVRPELGDDPQFRTRFRREVQASFRVQGPTTVTLVDFDTEAEQPWMAVEYIDGPPLSEVVPRSGPLSPARQFALAVALADALLEIHDHGLTHRDLKPDNVLLPAEGPKVIDLGIAAAADSVRLTAVGSVLGAPGWLSPEQVETGNATPASDIFAWGCSVGYAACGRLPFGEGAPHVLFYRVLNSAPDIDFGQLAPPLRSLVAAATERDPAARPSSAKLLERLLERADLPRPIERGRSVRDVLRRDWQGIPLERAAAREAAPATGATAAAGAAGATAAPSTAPASSDEPPTTVVAPPHPRSAPVAPRSQTAAPEAPPTASPVSPARPVPPVVGPVPPAGGTPGGGTPGNAAGAPFGAAGGSAYGTAAPGRTAVGPPPGLQQGLQGFPGTHGGFPPGAQPGSPGGPLLGAGPFAGAGGAPPWGGPAPVPAPGRSRRPLLIGLAVLVLVAIVAGVVLLLANRSSAEPLGAPAGLRAAPAEDAVQLDWQAVPSATAYRVHSDGRVIADRVTGTSHRVPLGNDTGTHQYTVVALGDEEEQVSPPSAPLGSAAIGPWGDARPIADEFPRIVPPDPTDRGAGGQTCSESAPDRDKQTIGIITCEYPNGVYLEILRYPDGAARDQRAGAISGIADDEITWSSSDGSPGGDLFLGEDSEGPWRWWSFTEKPAYAMYASWEGHTADELKKWWTDAPF